VPSAQATPSELTLDEEEAAKGRKPYPGDPDLESQLVAEDDRRLFEVKTIAALAKWSGLASREPYRMMVGSGYTLLLTPRREPYTINDLLKLAPQTFVHQPDGSYLLSEHLVVQAGATLNLTSAGNLELRLASDNKGFVSIINDGGRLEVSGTKDNRVHITSWDRGKGGPDSLTSDGRAYVRSIGGQVAVSQADFRHLGFWSGRTGGVSLTGTDRPNTGQLDDMGQSMKVATMHAKRVIRAKEQEKTAAAEKGKPGRVIDQVLPAGTLPLPPEATTPMYSYVSASMHDVTVDGCAFGLFVASANGVDIRDSKFSNSLVDGLVMHRYVTNAVVEHTQASENAGDGVVLARATTGIVLSELTASRNHRNGVTISGLPLATGPSATGTPIASYGNNALTNSSITGNGRYGVEVIGGTNISVQANDVVGNELGIVARSGARKVSIVGNRVTDPEMNGIAVRDDVRDAAVLGNVVNGGEMSLQVRNSSADVRRNTLLGARNHAVSAVGDASGLLLDENVIGGRGPSAIDHKRATGLDLREVDNDTSGWNDTTPWLVTLKRFLQPLTLLWLSLGLLVLVTAVRGLRRPAQLRHPYEGTRPLSTYSNSEVTVR
jgi:hypothetical protein